jgi:uncharacterized cupin superfamily protein
MEEMCIILAGSGVLRQDDVTSAIKEGDVIASGVGKAHQIINTGKQGDISQFDAVMPD